MARKISLDVEEMKRQRKAKKRKKFILKLLAVALLALAGFIVYMTRDTWLPFFHGIMSEYLPHKENTGEMAEGKFPIKISGSSDYQCELIDKYLAVLEDTKLYIYSADGKKIYDAQCSLKNSVLKTNGSKALIYDKGGSSFQLESKYKNIYSNKLDDKIVLARLSQNDYCAVITQSDKFLAVMSVYDASGNFIYRWKSIEGRVIDVAFNKVGDGCIVSSIKTSGGKFVTTLYSFNFNSSEPKEIWTSTPLDTLVMYTSVLSDGTIVAVGFDKCFYLNRNGEIIGSYSYPSDIVDFSVEGGVTALLLENVNKRQNVISVINDSPENVSEIKIDGRAKSVKIYGNYIYVMTDSQITAFSKSGEKVSEVSVSDEYRDFRKIDNYIYLLGNSEINRIDFNI